MSGREGKVRIVGGRWRGRRLAVPSAIGLRPTADRVRETLFNWLAPVISGARCLDLFAGTGALGFEAASRGAAWVTFVERDSTVAARLRANSETLGAHDVEVILADANTWLAGPGRQFDVIFLDPPFDDAGLPALCEALEVGGWLSPDALIYMEYPRGPAPLVPGTWETVREQTAGRVGCSLARRERSG